MTLAAEPDIFGPYTATFTAFDNMGTTLDVESASSNSALNPGISRS